MQKAVRLMRESHPIPLAGNISSELGPKHGIKYLSKLHTVCGLLVLVGPQRIAVGDGRAEEISSSVIPLFWWLWEVLALELLLGPLQWSAILPSAFK